MSTRSVSRNPVGLLFSPVLWASAWYLLAYLVIGWVLFAVAVTLVVGGGLLSLTLAGLPVLLAAAAVIRGCASFERARLRVMGGDPVQGAYREVTGSLHVEIAVFDCGLWPDCRNDLRPRNEFPWALNQYTENAECTSAQGQRDEDAALIFS